MAGTLASLFKEKYRTYFLQDPPSAALYEYLCGRNVDRTSVRNILAACHNQKVNTPFEAVALWHSFINALLLTRSCKDAFAADFLPVARELLSQNGWNGFPLLEALQALIGELVPGSVTEKKELNASHSYFSPEYFHLPIPRLHSELITIYALLGVVQKNSALQEEAKKMASQIVHFFDHDQMPFMALWSRCNDHSAWEILLSYYVMLYAVGHLFQEKKFSSLAQKIWPVLQSQLTQGNYPAPIFPILLINWIDELKTPVMQELGACSEESGVFYDPAFALSRLRKKDFSYYFTLCGQQTPLGAFHGKGVQIVAIGPQLFPLSDPQGFGIVRTGRSEKKTDDVIYKPSGDGFLLQGWTKLARSNAWLEFSIDANPRLCTMAINPFGVSEKIALALYVNGKCCHVGPSKQMKPKSLEQYAGNAKKIVVEGEKGSLSLTTQDNALMHVIPLAGKGFFWDADFLIAYELQENFRHLQIGEV